MSRSSEYNWEGSPGRETPRNLSKGNWIPLHETQARVEQVRRMKALQKTAFSTGGENLVNPPPPGYTGGYQGNAFNPKIWEAQKLVRKEKGANPVSPVPSHLEPPEDSTNP
jgi:hypothetical protein